MAGQAQVDTNWFQGKLSDKRLSQRRLASMMGLDPAAVSLMLNGKRKMTAVEASEVAKLLGVPLDEVLRHAGVDIPTGMNGHKVPLGALATPVVGWVDGEGIVHKGKALGPLLVLTPAGTAPDCVALRFQTNNVFDGWVAFYAPATGVSLEAVGQTCVIELDSGQCLIRWVRRGYEQGKFAIGGDYKPRIEGVTLKSAAPILWMKQR